MQNHTIRVCYQYCLQSNCDISCVKITGDEVDTENMLSLFHHNKSCFKACSIQSCTDVRNTIFFFATSVAISQTEIAEINNSPFSAAWSMLRMMLDFNSDEPLFNQIHTCVSNSNPDALLICFPLLIYSCHNIRFNHQAVFHAAIQ